MLTREIELDVMPGSVPKILHVKQYQTDVLYKFKLYTRRGTLQIGTVTDCAVRGTKSDGHGYSETATFVPSTSTVEVQITEQMTAVAGKQPYEITLSDSTGKMITATFYLDVQKAALDMDSISDSVIRELVDSLDHKDEIIQSARSVADAASRIEQTEAEFQGSVNAIVQLVEDSNATAAKALSRAGNVENDIAETNVQVENLNKKVDAVQLSMNEYVNSGYVENGVAYFAHDADVLFEITGIGGGGSGGGGGDQNRAVLTVTNTTGWLSKTVPSGSACPISVVWSSIEDDMATGDGTIRITTNGSIRATMQIEQGSVTVDLAPYIGDGSNIVRVQVADMYGNARTINFSVTVVALSISSTFDVTVPYTGAISFPYTPSGAVSKTVYFYLDGNLLGTQPTSVSNRQMTYPIPAQAHGAHTIRCYFECDINGETVRSNELKYEFMSVSPLDDDIIITTAFNQDTVQQYSMVNIPYRVYDPKANETAISISVNGSVVSNPTVDRTEQTFSYRANTTGSVNVTITAGTTSKAVSFTVTESDVDVEAETEDLVLYLNAEGRTNNDPNRSEWKSGDITAIMSNFNWKLDGWQKDSDGIDVLRLVGDARVTIPYKIFGSDFKTSGKTIEFEFATRDVVDYNAEIITCFTDEDNVGLKITSQSILFRGASTGISTLYKDNEHLKLSIVVEKQNENRLILIYINGIMSRAIQYASGERFSQLNPVNISLGSNLCGLDIYAIRVYDNNLNRQQVLENWIADTQIGNVMLERYSHNNIYDEYGRITTANLPSDLPYMIIETPQLPQYKGDKKTVSGSYHDPVYPSKSFEFVGCEIDAQGTSSSVYYVKNIDMKYNGGFDTPTAGNVKNYALRAGSIPFKRFVLKADVASSESTNNTGLTMFYNDTCPYKTPEMIQDDKVRWGIEGIPIVMFWYNPDTQETKFMGKYNFNLPKRAAAPYGYSGNDQSWEWERNNSANVKFQDDNFTDETWDEIKQEYYPTWYDDFEARFPDDTWRDYSALKEFISWVKSTARGQATNEDLPEHVTYKLNTTATITGYESDTSYTVTDEVVDGNKTGYKFFEFTKDTPAYRLTKFKAEMNDYMEIDSAVFYYLFTEFFLMIDSRAKNMFVGFHGSPVTGSGRQMTRKAVFEPYDMDTAVGTNNSGVLMFGYYLEDTDKVSSIISGGEGGTDANVFNAQDSVLWMNVRDSCRSEITAMYRSLRTGAWSYKIVESMYENHQSKWPEAIFNEDAYEKYLVPLVDPVTIDDATGQLIRTTRYLTMLQGSKAEQRKWWLYNRFRYMDSKYSTGDASANRINMRLFNNGTLTLKSAIDMYIGVYFGGGTTVALKRTTAGVAQSFPYQAGTTAQEMETWIDSADMITDVGDLSVFRPNELDFSRATRLRRLQIGSPESGYSNTNLTTIDVRNSALLEYIDLRNCPNLAITVDLEGSPRLEEAYFDNTAVTGVDLADGCAIEKLHLPGTITTLTLLNLTKLSEFVCPSFANVTRFMAANIDTTVVNPITILNQIPANSQVNIQGLALEVSTSAEIDAFYDLLDTMRGVTREKGLNGNWIYHDYDDAQVSGTIHIGSITGAEISAYNERYPYITINADHTTSYLTYVSYDNETVLKTVTCLDGVPQDTAPSAPAKPPTAQNTYTFVGWSKRRDQTAADPDYATEVSEDRTVYPAYTSAVRTYTVYFYNGSTLLQTVQDVPYGGTATYTGSTPVSSEGSAEDYPFEGWNPSPSNITGNTSCYAQFGEPVQDVEITDSWDAIIANIDNGTYATKYKVGNYKPIDLGTEGTINMQIVAFDADELASGGYAPISFVAKELLATDGKMNNESTTAGGYEASVMRSYLTNTILPLVPSNVAKRLQRVNKIQSTFENNAVVVNGQTTVEKLWIPSFHEVRNKDTNYESRGVTYDKIYKGLEESKKTKSGTAYPWHLRSVFNSSMYRSISKSGSNNSFNAIVNAGVCLGFCLGLEADTITDSWDDIIAATQDGTYSTKYSVGDTKTLDLGSEGKVKMQLVAMDTDILDGENGKAPTTWISKQVLNTKHRMNPSYQTNTKGTGSLGGYSLSEMRTYLEDTIKPLIPQNVRSAIKVVKKQTQNRNLYNGNITDAGGVGTLDVWIPSLQEVGYASEYETNGVAYSSMFVDGNSRIKTNVEGTPQEWWLRSSKASSNSAFMYIQASGHQDSSGGSATTARGVALGFCI